MKKGIPFFQATRSVAAYRPIGCCEGGTILGHPLHIALSAIPVLLQTLLIFGIGYAAAWLLRLPHDIAAPAAQIGVSDFFELAVAAAISLFGLESGAPLVTIAGVLVEVPIMLAWVGITNRTRSPFERRYSS